MFEIYLSNAALKALKNLDKRIEDKENSPYFDIYRLRISRYRIVYSIDWGRKEINVIKIDKKKLKNPNV